MHANNETGAINDVAAFGALCRAHGAALHVDAAQSAGKLPIDVAAMGIDLLSFTAHKLYGPKGIGALYVQPARRAGLQPLLFGGGHERGLRSGTLPVHQIVGFGVACELAASSMAAESQRQAALRAQLWAGIADLPGVILNSPAAHCLPGILNVSFTGIEGESLLFGLSELALASGSACNSDSDEPSYVLRALGRDRETAQSSLRFSFGRGTGSAEIDRAIAAVRREVGRLRAVAYGGGEAEAVSAEAGSREQGTWVRFMLKPRGELIEQASHQVYGCPQTLAACEWLASRLPGRSWRDPGLGGPQDWARALDIPLDRLTRLLVVEDALRGALGAAQRQQGGGSRITGKGAAPA
jgi:cysteine desulfurase